MMHVEFPNPFTNGVVIGDNIDTAEYLEQLSPRGSSSFVMSSSELREFNRCPSRWVNGYRDDGTRSTQWGDLVDCLVTNKIRFQQDFAVRPPTYEDEKGEVKKWNGNATVCKKWIASQGGKTIVSPDDYSLACQASVRLMGNARIAQMFDCSRKQVCVNAEYRDKETGIVVPVKCLTDLVPDKDHEAYGKSLADFKTSADAHPDKWEKSVHKFGYHVQAAWHLDLYVTATGEDRTDFRHVVQENFAPFQTACRILSTEFLNLGRATYTAALKRYCRCLATGEWPDYDSDAREHIGGWQVVQPRDWMLATS